MADNAPARGLPLYAQLPPAARQVLLLIGLAAAVAAGVALVLWSQGTQYSPLYTGLADRDTSEIAAMLDASGVPYKLGAGGALSVPADRKHEVRMQLASAGLPRGTGFGIEEMTERSSFGQTPFMENALYVKAFETELARSISSMQPVEAARVHLALPPPAVFARQKREPSASVMLQLYPGRRLDPAQVQAVVHLVASSVPELAPSRVVVVDQTGALLTNGAADTTAQLTATQFEYRKQVEQEYARRIEGLLGSVVGLDRVRASVSAQIDFTLTESTRESFDPNAAVVRSEQTNEDSQRGAALGGVPGALSNQPPEVASPPPGANGAADAEAVNVSRSVVRNYEIDKTVSHTKQAVGAIERLSIGVLVDNKPGADPRGPSQPLTEEEVASMTELAKKAVGFDEARGDTITLLNSPFQPLAQLEQPAPPGFLDRPEVWSMARQGLGALLVLALAFFVLKPIMQVLTRPQPVAALPAGQDGAYAMPIAGGRAFALPVSYDDRMAAARSVAGQDPRQVAQVVRSWVAEDNG